MTHGGGGGAVAAVGREIRNAVLVTAFLTAVAYANGVWFIPLWLANLAGALPAAGSWVWRAAFPLQSTLRTSALAGVVERVVPGEVADLTELPFFAEAAPFFLVGVGLEVVVAVVVCRLHAYRMNDALGSLACGLLSRVGGAAVGISMVPAYTAIWERWSLPGASVTSPVSWVAGLLFIDAGYYAFHRASHAMAWLWASHGVHHSSEEYNLTTALRQNLMDGVGGFVAYLPAAFFVPLPLAVAHKSFNLLWQYGIHTRTVGRLGWAEAIFNTPSHHRVHHARNPAAIDCNFAGIFIIWDRLCGTFVDERSIAEPLVYGVVPPIRGFSPLWANIVEWQGIFDRALATPGVLAKLSLLVRPPGTRYSPKAGGFVCSPVPPIGHRVNPPTRWDPGVSRHPVLVAYAWANFAALTAAFLAGGTLWNDVPVSAVGAVVFGISLHVATGILEGDPWVHYIDAARCIIAAVAVRMAAATASGMHLMSPTTAAVVVSVLVALALANAAIIAADPAMRAAAAAKLGATGALARWYCSRIFGTPDGAAPATAPAAPATTTTTTTSNKVD